MAIGNWACTRSVTLDTAEGLLNLLRFVIGGAGPLTSNLAEVGAFLRTAPTQPDPDIQLLFAPAWYVSRTRRSCRPSRVATCTHPR